MIQDLQLRFDTKAALTATAASGQTIDGTGGALAPDGTSQDANLGIGEPMDLIVTLDVAASATNGNETYSVALVTSDTVDGSNVPASATTLGTITIARGDAAGTRYTLALSAGFTYKKYLGLTYTLGGTSPSVTLTAEIMPRNMVDNLATYKRGYTVD